MGVESMIKKTRLVILQNFRLIVSSHFPGVLVKLSWKTENMSCCEGLEEEWEHSEMIKVNESITVQLEQTIDILSTGLIVVGNSLSP